MADIKFNARHGITVGNAAKTGLVNISDVSGNLTGASLTAPLLYGQLATGGTLSIRANSTDTTGTVTLGSAVAASSTLSVSGNFAVNTNKLTVDSVSGNTAVAGSLSAASATLTAPLPIGSGGTEAITSGQAISSIAPGAATTGHVLTYNGLANSYSWLAPGALQVASGTTIASGRQIYTATAGQTVFTGCPNYVLGSFQLRVYINGVRKNITSHYNETSTTSFTLTAGATVGDIVLAEVDAYTLYSLQANFVSNVPSGNISSTDVQAALNELDVEKANKTDTFYIGTTGLVLNRASGAVALTGITSISGSAATLTTPRSIYGNNFDGSAALIQIITSTYGGTGNGFTKFTGPTTAEKTFTLPDASSTLLYSGGALGTPSSGVATNLTGTAAGLTAGNATKWATARNLSLTGDGTATLASMDGSADVSGALTLATVNSNVGSFGSATAAPVITVNGKGLVTAAGTATITPAIGSVTGLGTGVATALGANVDSAGSPVVNGGALGTPSSGVATNLTGTAAGLTAGNATSTAPIKLQCRVATTANITLSGGAPNTLDGGTLAANDRILVKNQSTASENGIYIASTLGTGSNGTWTRATDADGAGELLSGMLVTVSEGTVNADSMWMLTTDDPITIGTTALMWERKDAGAVPDVPMKTVRTSRGGNVANLASGAPDIGDGVSLAVNDRILVIGQSTASQNGIYVVTVVGTGSNGTWVRAADVISSGMLVTVSEGTVNADSMWMLTTDDPITIGTTALTWVRKDVIGIPQNSQSANYTTVLADANTHLLHPSADTTARTFTINSNANVPYPIGTAITFVNQNAAGVLTIAITTDTMRLAGTGTTGSRTLAANGMATALKLTASEWIISGTGLT